MIRSLRSLALGLSLIVLAGAALAAPKRAALRR